MTEYVSDHRSRYYTDQDGYTFKKYEIFLCYAGMLSAPLVIHNPLNRASYFGSAFPMSVKVDRS